MVFQYSRFELVRYAVLIWVLATMALWTFVNPSIRKVHSEIQNEIRLRNAELIEEVAKKLRHNIRSPLAVLNALFVDRVMDKDEFLEQGQRAVLRLEEIVAEIKSDFRGDAPKQKTMPALFEMTKVLKAIVDEKTLISKQIPITLKIEGSLGPVYSEIPSADLKATLSNLIDNSLQAYRGLGEVEVRLDADDFSISLSVVDSGRGIPESVLQSVFEKGFTFGKSGGTGLGLYYAKKLVEESQGNIDIASVDGQGTVITMLIPRKTTPSWHVDRISLNGVDNIVVCDDVQGILKAWEVRLRSLTGAPAAQFYSRTEDIPKLDDDVLYLLDYDMGPKAESGLAFAQRLRSGSRAYLVTGHFDAPEIQAACAEIGCKLLPKDEIASIQIV